jgi:hypothetical protein
VEVSWLLLEQTSCDLATFLLIEAGEVQYNRKAPDVKHAYLMFSFRATNVDILHLALELNVLDI